MILKIEINGKSYLVDWVHPIDLSIPLQFGGDQPRFFGVPAASAQPYKSGGFIGDTRQGGSCNVEEYRLIPHCNGTHTECVGHIVRDKISVHKTLRKTLVPCSLISLQPQFATTSADNYSPAFGADDKIITASLLKKALENCDSKFLTALIIRTLPNDPQKMSRNYGIEPAPFFSLEAMNLIHDFGVEHLLVDLPSVDRANDEGEMAAHHIFWDVPQGNYEIDPQHHSCKTITEMIYVPDSTPDGAYLLNLQISAFVADAAPGRPVVFALQEVD